MKHQTVQSAPRMIRCPNKSIPVEIKIKNPAISIDRLYIDSANNGKLISMSREFGYHSLRSAMQQIHEYFYWKNIGYCRPLGNATHKIFRD